MGGLDDPQPILLGDNLVDVPLRRLVGRSARSSTVPLCITGMTLTCRTSLTSGRRRCGRDTGGPGSSLLDEDVWVGLGGSWVLP